jgi:hypothetical protein
MGVFGRIIRNWKLWKLQRAVDKKRLQLAEVGIQIEEYLHSLKPTLEKGEFVPSFPAWVQLQQNKELNIEEALDIYIDEFNLLPPTTTIEPADLLRISTRLRVLNESKDKFASEVQADLDRYIFALNADLMIRRMKWEVDQKRKDLEKGSISSDDDSK